VRYNEIDLARQGPVARITLNRPDRLNALTVGLLKELQAALAGLAADPQTRVVVLTGAGDQAFVAGADIKELAAMSAPQFRDLSLEIMRTIQQIMAHPQPVIGALNGHALGGGLALARACDIVVAVEDAWLGQPEINLGIYGGSFGLHLYIGKVRAWEMVLLGESVTARQAEAMGLINRAVPREALWAAVDGLVDKLLAKSPAALAQAKRSLKVSLEHGMELGGWYQAENVSLLLDGPEQREAMQAWLEKRPPHFAARRHKS